MMELMNPLPPAELPAEALLARLRSRRALLGAVSSDTKQPHSAPTDSFQEVLDWVYARLDRQLRKRLQPYLQIVTMRILEQALRFRMAGDLPPDGLLRSRLLHPGIKALLRTRGEASALLASVAQELLEDCPYVSGLAETFRNQGPGAVELQLNNGVLKDSLGRAEPGILKTLVRCLIDQRNLMAVHKYWRWQTSIPPQLIAGGTFSKERLLKTWSDQDHEASRRMIHQLTGLKAETEDPRHIELLFYKGISRLLRRAGRAPLSLGVPLDYLWRVQLAACNSRLRQTLGEDQPDLLAEVLLA